MKKIKSILALALVLIMAMTATSTVFARGFGGGRMAQGQRQCTIEQCRLDESEGRNLGRGLGRGVCRRLP